MAVTQYIGARYVPKFYENSDGTEDWRSGVEYEPLTIVSYNGNSYTSKKPVPSNIGNPSENPAYWVSTGNYNQQVEAYRQEVEAYKATVDNLIPDVGTLQQNIKRSFILIGDSFSVGLTTSDGTNYSLVGGWADHCKTAMETAGYDVYINTRNMSGNTGFASSLNFLSLLQAIEEDHVGDKANEITDIVVIGGTNDLGHEAGIVSGIETFCNYAHTHFPNAKIKIGVIGTYIGRLHNNIEPNYSAVRFYGGVFISDLINLFCKPEYICADGLHLTQTGYEFYWTAVLDAIITGNAHYKLTVDSTLTVDTTNFTGNNNLHLYTTYTEDSFYLQIDSSSPNNPISFVTSPNDTPATLDVFTIGNAPVFPVEYGKFAHTNILSVYTSAQKVNVATECWLYVAGNKLAMYKPNVQFPETSANYFYFIPDRTITCFPT